MYRLLKATVVALVLVSVLVVPVSAGGYTDVSADFLSIEFNPGGPTVGSPTGDTVTGKVKLSDHHGKLRINAHLNFPPGNIYTIWAIAPDSDSNAGATKVNASGKWNFKADVDPDVFELHIINHGPDIGDPEQYTIPPGGCLNHNPDGNECAVAFIVLP